MPVSVIRKFLLWWFDAPFSPWVSTSGAIDFRAAQAYLTELANGEGPKVSIQHLICAAVARALKSVPEANARIIGQRIFPQKHVGIAMPVNLLGHKAGKSRELSMTVVSKVETMSLRELAAATQKVVKQERSGQMSNPFLRHMLSISEYLPQSVGNRFLNRFDALMRNPTFAQKVYELFPITTGVTNPGSVIPPDLEGVLFRGTSINIPDRMVHVGTLWGFSAIQKEVLAINDEPMVCPVLPVMVTWDHRLIDGVKASQLILRFANIIQDPAAEFGPASEN
ncbi:MAG: 2-oxo acid dehydrogenase subunit E2 [Myxococcota bacterium]|nr:2-oxo acid dehydrogenase subunit E2 [Myxococcota bacterium]MEC8381542.1 2-oxo acid dehydrogenase subunit E2 [Myxococcota bacterium]